MRSSSLLLSLILTTTACVDAPEFDTATTHNGIVNGALDNGHLEVVRVFQFDPTYPGGITEFCTGTLIATRTVLTAAHCTFGYTGQPYTNVTVTGVTREYDYEFRRWFTFPFSANATISRHPSYSPATNAGIDLAVLTLPEPINGVPPAALATTSYATLPLTLVGYGGTSASDPNWGQTKRFGYNSVDSVDQTYLYFTGLTGGDAGTCYGDSGGPAYGGGYSSRCIVGVTKGMLSGGSPCVSGTMNETRVDSGTTAVNSWIRAQTAEAIGTCTP